MSVAAAEVGTTIATEAFANSAHEAGVAEDAPISALLKSATREAHSSAESRPFVTNLMSGKLTTAAYIALAVQQAAIYQALEQAGERILDQEGARTLVREELLRCEAIATDLAFLVPDGNLPAVLESTKRYVARLDEINDLASYAAHAYTRYLGDLSGGQAIKAMLKRHYGLGDEGLAFYTFAGIAKIPPYKASYRTALDELPLDEAGRNQIVAEAKASFGFNEAIFAELGEEYFPAN